MAEEEEGGSVTAATEESVPQLETTTQDPTEEKDPASLESEEGGEAEGEESDGEKSRANDRIRQEIERRKESDRKLEELESRVAELTKAKDTIPAIDEKALNTYLGTMRDQVETLRYEGNHLQADILDRQRNKLIDEYETWQKQAEAKKGEQTESQQWTKTLADVDTTALMYRDQYKIPAPLWDEMGKWFVDEMKSNKVVEAEFIDILKRQGPVSAVRFAHNQAKPVFDAKAKALTEAKAKKDAAKNGQLGAGGANGKAGYSSFQQVLNLGSKAVEAYKKANPAHYQKLLDAHIK